MSIVPEYANDDSIVAPYAHQLFPDIVAASYNLLSPYASSILHEPWLFTGSEIFGHSLNHVGPEEHALFGTTSDGGAEVNLHSLSAKASQVNPASVDGADVHFPFLGSGFPNPPVIPIDPAMERAGAAAFTVTLMKCRWGVHCGRTLTDCSPAGVARHLQAFHCDNTPGAVKLWRDRSMGACQWSIGGILCGKTMFVHNYAKHVACVHLRSTKRRCPGCLRPFSRSDALKRHSKACKV